MAHTAEMGSATTYISTPDDCCRRNGVSVLSGTTIDSDLYRIVQFQRRIPFPSASDLGDAGYCLCDRNCITTCNLCIIRFREVARRIRSRVAGFSDVQPLRKALCTCCSHYPYPLCDTRIFCRLFPRFCDNRCHLFYSHRTHFIYKKQQQKKIIMKILKEYSVILRLTFRTFTKQCDKKKKK